MKLAKKIAITSAGIYAATLLALPAAAFAASNGGTAAPSKIPLKHKSQEECLASVSTFKVSEIQTYGNARIKVREESLNKLDKQIEKVFAREEAKKATEKANEEVKNTLSLAKVLSDDVVEPPKSSKETLNAEIKKIRVLLVGTNGDGGFKADLKNAQTPSEAATATCNAIWETRVYSFLKNKVYALKKVDNLYNANVISKVRYKAIVKTVRQLDLKPSQLDITKLPNPSATEKRINAMETAVVGVTLDPSFKTTMYKTALSDYAATKKEIKDNRKPINKAYKKLQKIIKKRKQQEDNKRGANSGANNVNDNVNNDVNTGGTAAGNILD